MIQYLFKLAGECIIGGKTGRTWCAVILSYSILADLIMF